MNRRKAPAAENGVMQFSNRDTVARATDGRPQSKDRAGGEECMKNEAVPTEEAEDDGLARSEHDPVEGDRQK